MIKVIGDYYLTVETAPAKYVVRKGKGEKIRTGQWEDKPRGCFSTLYNAILYIRGEIIADELEGGALTLRDALMLIKKTDNEFAEIMGDIKR